MGRLSHSDFFYGLALSFLCHGGRLSGECYGLDYAPLSPKPILICATECDFCDVVEQAGPWRGPGKAGRGELNSSLK